MLCVYLFHLSMCVYLPCACSVALLLTVLAKSTFHVLNFYTKREYFGFEKVEMEQGKNACEKV